MGVYCVSYCLIVSLFKIIYLLLGDGHLWLTYQKKIDQVLDNLKMMKPSYILLKQNTRWNGENKEQKERTHVHAIK
jgi:hypothetical protein